jgi:hypothetical protein
MNEFIIAWIFIGATSYLLIFFMDSGSITRRGFMVGIILSMLMAPFAFIGLVIYFFDLDWWKEEI